MFSNQIEAFIRFVLISDQFHQNKSTSQNSGFLSSSMAFPLVSLLSPEDPPLEHELINTSDGADMRTPLAPCHAATLLSLNPLNYTVIHPPSPPLLLLHTQPCAEGLHVAFPIARVLKISLETSPGRYAIFLSKPL